MGIISNCFGFNFSKGENSNKKTKPNFLLVSLESRGNQICWLKIRRRKMKMILVWQVWGRSAAVVCHHRELQQLLNRHCRFFPSTCQKKRATWKGVKSVETTSTYLHSTIGRWYLRLIHLHQGTPFYHSILTGAYPYLKIDTLKISCPKNALWPRIWGWML